MLEAKSKIIGHQKAKTLYLTIPSSVAHDSAFPFKTGQTVKIRIENKRLVVE